MFVVAVLGERFHRFVVHHVLEVGQATQRVVAVQVHTGATGSADVGQRAVGRAAEEQKVAEDVLDTLRRNSVSVSDTSPKKNRVGRCDTPVSGSRPGLRGPGQWL